MIITALNLGTRPLSLVLFPRRSHRNLQTAFSVAATSVCTFLVFWSITSTAIRRTLNPAMGTKWWILCLFISFLNFGGPKAPTQHPLKQMALRKICHLPINGLIWLQLPWGWRHLISSPTQPKVARLNLLLMTTGMLFSRCDEKIKSYTGAHSS